MSNPIHPTSQTPQQLTLTKLKQLMPEAFSEGQLDIHKLTALLSEQDIAPAQEAYGLSWAGKHQVYRELKTPTSQTLVPQPDESVDFDTSQNLFIEGDNLAVLKILQKSYHSRIKMIYIDPPYNTGNDRFVYADDFSESIADYKARAGQTDEDGNLTHSDGMQSNRKENGQYHSNWLNMMYPRLALAKSLLRDDGVIFVSIDDNEVANLRLLMDEVFGEENFVDIITRATGTPTGGGNNAFVNELDYIVVYARNSIKLNIEGFDLTKSEAKIYDQEDKYGTYLTRPLRRTGGEDKREDRPSMYFPITAPDGTEIYPIGPTGYESRWICGEKKYHEMSKENLIEWKMVKDKWQVYQKFYLEGRKKLPGNLWNDVEGNKKATRDVRKIFDTLKVFDHPKPVGLIEKIISCVDTKSDIILDFFAGSSTTAHAVMALNAEEAENNEAGKRKFIMVQIPEATEADSEAYKAGFSNIAEISKERIRRAAAHITSELPESVDSKALDFGFKAYKLADSNFIPWQQPTSYDADSLMAQLEKHLDPIVDTATTDGIITELMLKEGYTLTADVIEVDGYYLVTQNDALNQSLFNSKASENTTDTAMRLAIVLDDMTTSKATQIIARAPNKTLIMDRAFSDDANKANIVLQFEDAGLVVGCV